MYSIAVIPGDGIGPEVLEQALDTLDQLDLSLKFETFDQVNATSFLRTGTALTDEDFDRVKRCAGALLGAVGDPRIQTPEYGKSILLRLRFELDLYVNYRPARLLHDRLSPLREAANRAIDCVIVRENTEGLYAGIGGTLRPRTANEVAIDTEISTYLGISRVIEFAMHNATRSVCMVDKANAVPAGGDLWRRCLTAASERYPAITTSHLYVDAAAAELVRHPGRFEVIVTNNSYGDILSDIAAEIAGGLGTAASANLNPETGFGLYEPVHGSAPDIAGTGAANPVGAILSAALLLEHLGFPGEAAAVRAAVERTIEAGRCTADIGGTLTTRQAGAAIRAAL